MTTVTPVTSSVVNPIMLSTPTLLHGARDRLRHGLYWFVYGLKFGQPDPETDDFYMVKRAARCRTCHGDGFVGIGDTAIHCDECDGSGYYWWLL